MEVGEKIGRYLILSRLGAGGMGTVYKAQDTHLERVVAIKLLSILVASDPQASQRFLREAKTSAKLRHPNIVTVYDFAQEGKKYYLVMDYIEGWPLDVLLKEKKIGVISACKIMMQILSAMAHAHQQKIVHRDIKPANILLDARGMPYVSDFGLAKALSGDSTKISQTGAIMGTPCYMSPEQAAGDPSRPVDARSDIYSLGAVFYELLAGKVPFGGDSIFHILYKLANDPVPRPREFNPKIPAYLENVCLKALEKNKSDRYQCARDMRKAIEDYLQQPDSLSLTQKRNTRPKVDTTGVAPTIKVAPGPQLKKSRTYVPVRAQNRIKDKPKKSWLWKYGLVFASVLIMIALVFASKRQKHQNKNAAESETKQQEYVTEENESAGVENSETTDSEGHSDDDETTENENDDTDDTNDHEQEPIIEIARGLKAFQAFDRLRVSLKKGLFDSKFCSAEFAEEDLADEEELKAFVVYGRKLFAGEIRPIEQESAVKLKSPHGDFYMVEEHGRWKYDGTNLQRMTRKKNLQKYKGPKYRSLYDVYWNVAAMTMRGEAADICSESLFDWQREIILMRLRRIFKYSFVRGRGLYGTPDREIIVFLLDVADRKRQVKLVMKRENGKWVLADIR